MVAVYHVRRRSPRTGLVLSPYLHSFISPAMIVDLSPQRLRLKCHQELYCSLVASCAVSLV